jgi:hypothetical protein
MADWQLLAAAPAPPTGMAEFMALAKRLFGEEGEGGKINELSDFYTASGLFCNAPF